jgi:head-tail adaptor
MPLTRLSSLGGGSTTPIGSMNRWITVQKRTATNSDGQQSGPYTDFMSLWVRIDQLAGKEVVNNVQYAAEVSSRFLTGHAIGIEPRMRIKYVDFDGFTHFFDILFVNQVQERGFFLELLAQEIVTAL